MTPNGKGREAGRVIPLGGASGGLRMHLFGPMEVCLGSGPLPRLRSRKGLWLLALLALRNGRDVERNWLAGTLWPDSDEADARRSLRQSLHNLRLALGSEAERLACQAPGSLRLDVSGVFVDVLAFDAAVTRGDLDALETAVGLYRGTLLEGCAEEWSAEAREQREQRYVSALETLAAAAAAREEHAAAARYLRRGVAADPFREELQRALMQALAASGNLAGALLVYRQFRALLWREMTTEPADETTALFRRLREETRARAARRHALEPPAPVRVRAKAASSSTAAPPSAALLPAPLTALIGRDEAVRDVLACLARARLVTLTGPGGIGKTRLALQVARKIAGEHDSSGARFVSLAALAEPNTVPEAVRAALGIPPGDAAWPSSGVLRRYLFSRRRLVLVLDNCEHVLDACAQLADALLCQCPLLRILATSREALGLRGETIWRVPSLALPPPAGRLAEPAAAAYPAVQLFVARARAVQACFEITPGNAPTIAQVCRQLDGVPLAIEMAAARVRSLSVEEISARLHNGFGLLTDTGRAQLPRQQTLAATFDWSWDLLSSPEQTLLRRLSVFAGGWTLEAAEMICTAAAAAAGVAKDSSVEDPTVLDLLTGLVDKSLVLYRPAAGAPPRYHLLETVRQYAAQRLRASGDDAETTRNRHRDFFLHWAEKIKPCLWGAEQAGWFSRLESEHENLSAALDWCGSRANDAEQQLRLVVALSRFWDTHGHLHRGRAHLEAALSRMTPDLPCSLCTAALVHAGWMAYVLNDYPAARRYYEQALVLLRKQNDKKTRADALNYLALVAMEEKKLRLAQTLFEESLALCRECGQSARLGSVLSNLGNLALRQADYAAARSYLEQSVSWCEFVGDQQLHGLVLHDLSVADLRQGRNAQARAHCAASLRLLHACGAIVNIPSTLDQMAQVQQEAQGERAARLLGAAEGLREAWGMEPLPRAAPQRGANTFAAAFVQGKAMSLEQVIEYALLDPSEENG